MVPANVATVDVSLFMSQGGKTGGQVMVGIESDPEPILIFTCYTLRIVRQPGSSTGKAHPLLPALFYDNFVAFYRFYSVVP